MTVLAILIVEARFSVAVDPDMEIDETVTAVPESETLKAEVAAVVEERASL